MEFFEFFSPTRIIAGAGLAGSLGRELADAGFRRCFLVTDRQLEQLGLSENVQRSLSRHLEIVGVFSEAVPDSGVELVEMCAASARTAEPDVILALGGGSVIDTAKAANLVLSLGGRLLDYEGYGVINAPLLPLVAVPTTAGSGSEVTRFAVIKDEARQAKVTFVSPYLAPSMAVLDGELTLGLPPNMTAVTGMDALTHAVESHLSLQANPFSSGLALEAVRQIFYFLPRAAHNGDDLEARQAMLVAATMAGMAFSSTMVGVVHALAHACGGLYGVPHGLANAILLPWGMRYNRAVAAEKLADIARAAGVSGAAQAEEAILAVEELRSACGLVSTLADAGVPADGLAALAEAAAYDGAAFTNPREIVPDELLKLLRDVYYQRGGASDGGI